MQEEGKSSLGEISSDPQSKQEKVEEAQALVID
jgi:hypothetical protein